MFACRSDEDVFLRCEHSYLPLTYLKIRRGSDARRPISGLCIKGLKPT